MTEHTEYDTQPEMLEHIEAETTSTSPSLTLEAVLQLSVEQ